MFRHFKGQLNAFALFFFSALIGFLILKSGTPSDVRQPAAASDWSKADFDMATPSVSMSEAQNSKPAFGRSYFDQVFSEKNEYKVPYPFNQFLNRLSDYTGQKINAGDFSGIKVTLFPMGRSLQRNAAVVGLSPVTSMAPFFRFPRIVIGVDEETAHPNSLLLNLKNKFYVGFNEKAQILEIISYNDDEGRFEYQVVHDYAAGKNPKVAYANRTMCLSCHQNQGPLFSRGPWSESNANPVMAESLRLEMDKSFGKPACTIGANQTYCYQNQKSFYFGAPVQVEPSVLSKLDASTDEANLTQTYQKMWKELCVSSECKVAMLNAMILYRITGQVGLISSLELSQQLQAVQSTWKTIYPWGLSVPNPNIPNRDPLKDFTMNQGQPVIPAEFEPLLARPPIDILKNSGLEENNTNQMIRGLAQEFTFSDLKMIDTWLQNSRRNEEIVTELGAGCELEKDQFNLSVTCRGTNDESFDLSAYVVNGAAVVSEFKYKSKALNCDPSLPQTVENIFNGRSCPSYSDLSGTLSKLSETQILFSLQKNALSLRGYQGYDFSEILIDLKTKKASMKVYNQNDIIKNQLQKIQAQLAQKRPFSRFKVMKIFATLMSAKPHRTQPEVDAQMPIVVDADLTSDDIEEQMTGVSLMKNVCAQCHQNNNSSPPSFMGSLTNPLNQFEQCRRVEQCAPRMIYRLKMRNCDVAEQAKKKNPMPPGTFFKDETAATTQWMNLHNPKIIRYLKSLVSEKELAQHLGSDLAAQDILNSECPESNSGIYDQLPKCEFDKLKPVTRCR